MTDEEIARLCWIAAYLLCWFAGFRAWLVEHRKVESLEAEVARLKVESEGTVDAPK